MCIAQLLEECCCVDSSKCLGLKASDATDLVCIAWFMRTMDNAWHMTHCKKKQLTTGTQKMNPCSVCLRQVAAMSSWPSNPNRGLSIPRMFGGWMSFLLAEEHGPLTQLAIEWSMFARLCWYDQSLGLCLFCFNPWQELFSVGHVTQQQAANWGKQPMTTSSGTWDSTRWLPLTTWSIIVCESGGVSNQKERGTLSWSGFWLVQLWVSRIV